MLPYTEQKRFFHRKYSQPLIFTFSKLGLQIILGSRSQRTSLSIVPIRRNDFHFHFLSLEVVMQQGGCFTFFLGNKWQFDSVPIKFLFQAACYFEHCSHQRESLNFHFHFLKVGSENAYLLKHCSCQEKVFYTSIFFPILEVRMHISLNFVPRRKASTRSAASFNLAAKSWEQFLQTFGRTKLPFTGAMISSTESCCAKP